MAKQATPEFPRARPAIRRMAPYRPPTDGRAGKLRLDFNENTIGCSPRVIEVLRKTATQQFLAVYPEYQASREKIAPFFGVDPEQLTFADGTDEAIQLLVHTYVDAAEEVLIPWPTFPIFRVAAESVGAKVKLIRYPKATLNFRSVDCCGQSSRLLG